MAAANAVDRQGNYVRQFLQIIGPIIIIYLIYWSMGFVIDVGTRRAWKTRNVYTVS